MTATPDCEVVVIGAGIAGLVAAVRLQRAGIHTVLIEEREVVGGLLAPTSLGDTVVDAGAESFATRNSSVRELIDELGLGLTIVSPSPAGAMLLAGSGRGRVRRTALPRATVLGIPSRPWARDVRAALGITGAIRASLDALIPRTVGSTAASIGELAHRRMGRRVRSSLVDPIARSVYSTAASELDIDTVSPRLRTELAERGSLARAAASITSGVKPGSAVNGIEGGLFRLAIELAAAFVSDGGELITGWRAGVLSPSGSGAISVVADRQGNHRLFNPSEVIVATPGPHAAVLTRQRSAQLSEALNGAVFRGVTVACVRVVEPALDSFPVGSGVIVAENAGMLSKALTHLNAKWGWYHLPAHEHLLRLSFDGTDPETLRLAADRDQLAGELSSITGVPIAPASLTAVTVAPWPDAVVPLGAQTRRTLTLAIAAAERDHITCVGSWASGTGLASVIPYATDAANRVIGRRVSSRLSKAVITKEREP